MSGQDRSERARVHTRRAPQDRRRNSSSGPRASNGQRDGAQDGRGVARRRSTDPNPEQTPPVGWTNTAPRTPKNIGEQPPRTQDSPPPPCDIPSGCCSFTGPWTLTRSSLRMLRWVAAFCRPLRPVLLLVSFPRSRSPIVGVPGLCWTWRDVPFVRQRRPVGVLRPPHGRHPHPHSAREASAQCFVPQPDVHRDCLRLERAPRLAAGLRCKPRTEIRNVVPGLPLRPAAPRGGFVYRREGGLLPLRPTRQRKP